MKIEVKLSSSPTITGTEKFSNSTNTPVSAVIKENGNTTTIKAEPSHFAKLGTSPQSSYVSCVSHVVVASSNAVNLPFLTPNSPAPFQIPGS